MVMSANKPAGEDKKDITVVADDPHAPQGALKHIGGSQSDNWNDILAKQTIQTLWLAHSDDETRGRQFSATITALIEIGPKDEIEGMIAAQLIAAHNATMECYRRAMIGEQTLEGRRDNFSQVNKLSRTYAVLLDACLLLGAELDQVLRLSLVWKHVEHMITFLFDMMGDLFPLVLWNKKCVDCYLVSPSRPR